MARMEELTVGSIVKGLVNNESVQVVAIRWYGSTVLEKRRPGTPHQSDVLPRP